MTRVLAISSAYGGCAAAVTDAERTVASGEIHAEMGLAAALPALVEHLLDKAGRALDLVAVLVGPGSFTGLRAGISVASGIALALDIPVVGVTTSEALTANLPGTDGRAVWTAIEARRGRVFIDRGSGFQGFQTGSLPSAAEPIAVCGNAANLVAAAMAAGGASVMLTDRRRATPQNVAFAALRRLSGNLPTLPAVPLYVDAPEARLPVGGLRAAPV